MQDRDIARLLAWGRIAIGGALFLAPRTTARWWSGEEQPSFPTNMIVRGLGARDVILGAGTAAALESGGSAGTWLQACAAADASDAIGTISAFGDLPKGRAVLYLVAEVGAAILGLSLAESLE